MMKRLLREIKTQKRFHVLILFVQAVCMLTIFFTIGLLVNNEYLTLETDSSTLRLYVQLNDEKDALTTEEMWPMLDELVDVLKNKYTEICFAYRIYNSETYHSMHIFDYFTYKDGKISRGETYNDTFDGEITVGRTIKEDDYTNENHVAIIGTGYKNVDYGMESIDLFGTLYEIVGERHTWEIDDSDVTTTLIIPVTSWGDIPVTTFAIYLRCLMTEKNKEQVESILAKYYWDAEMIIEDFSAENADLTAVYRSVFIISIIMLIADLGVMSMLYGYIFTHKRKKIAISALCGCSRTRNICEYVLGNFVLNLFSNMLGLVVFLILKDAWLIKWYPYMNDIFTIPMICTCFFGMLALSLLHNTFMALINIRKNVISMM